MDLEKYFMKLRFDPKHHLGLGDIRLTIGQQEEIIALVEEKNGRKNKVRTRSIRFKQH